MVKKSGGSFFYQKGVFSLLIKIEGFFFFTKKSSNLPFNHIGSNSSGESVPQSVSFGKLVASDFCYKTRWLN